MLAIGCECKPRRIQIKPSLSYNEKEKLRDGNGCTNEIHTIDYDYEGLENFLTDLTRQRSCILWSFLINSLSSRSRSSRYDFFKGEYSWFYYSPHSRTFESQFLKALKTTAWLLDSNDNHILPSQTTLSELPDGYSTDDDNADILRDILGFQIDEIRRIEETTGGKFISKIEYEQYCKWKEEKSKQQDREEFEEDDSWISEVQPESVEPVVEELEPQIIETPDYRGQRPPENHAEEPPKETDTQEEPRGKRLAKQMRDIGNWGERYVLKHLQEKFADENETEIICLNEEGGVGKGYDFSIVTAGEEIEYIEVKSKIDDKPQLFEITGTQWEFARKLYNENEGDKYKIYVVSSAGSDDAKIGIIENPTGLWKEGKLYAHPVHFKL